MIVVRTVFQAEWNKAGELAHAMHQGIEGMQRPAGAGHWRILTDLSGPFHTVVMEVEVGEFWRRGSKGARPCLPTRSGRRAWRRRPA